jgi:alcohol dehydrogenase
MIIKQKSVKVKIMKNLFITGIGSGLGKALVKTALNKGYNVYALSRHLPEEFKGKIKFVYCDLRALESIHECMKNLIDVPEISLAILNAGILGDIKEMTKTNLYEINEVMDINVWSNKVIIDFFIKENIKVNQLIGISSGAAVNANKGWGGYSISKAALNILLKLYSREMVDTHVIALAPGLVLTPMLEYILNNVDEEKFPSVKRLKESPKQTPQAAAEKIFNLLDRLKKEFPSGEFVDIRKI